MKDILFLLLSLLFILASAEFFTNGIEFLGRRLSLSQAVVGSILAAVGTALPETILPLVAIMLHGGEGKQIGVGAILGAPFMLSTLAFFLIGLTVTANVIKKKRGPELKIEIHSIKRDLIFFIAMYGAALFVPLFAGAGRPLLAAALVAGYIFYAYRTFRCESADIMHAEDLYFERIAGAVGKIIRHKNRTEEEGRKEQAGPFLIGLQVLFGLVIMVCGAHTFVGSLESLSHAWGMDPLIFALLVAPIATELPEKFNSVSWTLKGRDTLAMGNITGAMVFQSTFPVSVGLLLTDWNVHGTALLSGMLALSSAAVLLIEIQTRKRVSHFTVLLGGAFYALYAVVVIFMKR